MRMKRKFVIYVLVDPRDGKIRYVGSSINPHVRFSNHLRATENRRKSLWLLRLKRAGFTPAIDIIERGFGTREEQLEREAHHINRLKPLGDLLNCHAPRKFESAVVTEHDIDLARELLEK